MKNMKNDILLKNKINFLKNIKNNIFNNHSRLY